MGWDIFDNLFGGSSDRGWSGVLPMVDPISALGSLGMSDLVDRKRNPGTSGISSPFSTLPDKRGGPPAPSSGPGSAPTASAPANFTIPEGGFSPFDQVFMAHGATNPELLAIIAAGSYAESKWDPNIVGDNGHSVGLFQMHDQGAGAGMGDSRRDPNAASARMVPAYVNAYNQVKASNPNLSGAELASLVAAMAERPYDGMNPNSAARNGYRAAYNYVMSRRGQ